MPLNPVDTSTDHGSYKGDPAKAAFEKINNNFAYLAGLLGGGDLVPGNLEMRAPYPLLSFGQPGQPIGSEEAFLGGWGNSVFMRAWPSSTDHSSYTELSMSNASGLRLERQGTPLFQVSIAGVASAPQFVPTSSADVKDNLEGFGGDACELLDRLVVINYDYRDDFVPLSGRYVGLLAENVGDVIPSAKVTPPPALVAVTGPDGLPQVDTDGHLVTEERPCPPGVDMMQILALNTRAHQQKSKRIRDLQGNLSAVQAQLIEAQQLREDEAKALEQRLQALEEKVETLQGNGQPPAGQPE